MRKKQSHLFVIALMLFTSSCQNPESLEMNAQTDFIREAYILDAENETPPHMRYQETAEAEIQ